MQVWSEHFRLEQGEILPLTAEGRVTVKILRFNLPERVEERLLWAMLGQVVSPEGVEWVADVEGAWHPPGGDLVWIGNDDGVDE